MKKVLLVIDGVTPDQAAFNYALQLCRVIKAGLNILQIVSATTYQKHIKELGERAKRARKKIEESMVAAAFAEAGEPEIAKEIMDEALKNLNTLLPESEKADIQCRITVKSESSSQEIKNYMNEHRDIVLTIYDSTGTKDSSRSHGKRKNHGPNQMTSNLPTPLVIIQARS